MTKKTLKHELYKHGSYLHSLKESGSEFVNIDDEINKLEELFQLASKKDTPPFAVGEYRAYKDRIYKITEDHDTYICCVELIDGVFVTQSGSYKTGEFYHGSAPATAEQIAEFKRAEQFAKHGRKLDEFRVGDRVMDERGKVFTVTHITNGYLFNNTEIIDSVLSAKLVKIAEDKNEI